ncbi:MmcQ/YjbR family DNA-binding protein [Catelliglobosispora koreensis]|uniref:MmcQ/YjbR family DNA-binding protein n=1 Tax=Catelliglobosispora koreensis TaxID=129052 RepID=UPI00035EC7B6|nr:MmcQ/YjbR family DNA-binding protein [Catelliglobosispora koreensis]
MISPEAVAEIALSMPGAHQGSHFTTIDFRVSNKIFCSLPKPGHMGMRISPAEQAALLQEDPETFSPASGAWGKQGWTVVKLETADPKQLRELITDAWRGVAPKKLLKEFDEAE